MVLSWRVDNGIVPKYPQLLMFYYQPLVCGTAQTFLLMSLYCSTLPTEYFIALKLSAIFMAELTSYFVLSVHDYKLFMLHPKTILKCIL